MRITLFLASRALQLLHANGLVSKVDFAALSLAADAGWTAQMFHVQHSHQQVTVWFYKLGLCSSVIHAATGLPASFRALQVFRAKQQYGFSPIGLQPEGVTLKAVLRAGKCAFLLGGHQCVQCGNGDSSPGGSRLAVFGACGDCVIPERALQLRS